MVFAISQPAYRPMIYDGEHITLTVRRNAILICAATVRLFELIEDPQRPTTTSFDCDDISVGASTDCVVDVAMIMFIENTKNAHRTN